ncbi:hypothetical protein HGA13_03720 [Nocardia speluncae]|uniref:Uncharacterized protein n=1 Tax=Nocardia speluncae TaxID=419477 RepID=A0A846X9S8_9NOCA|nr:hypothetical protein [Nocardia speluncae]NKY32185.1 hypothetical protein [Nocardia speluncae]
MPETRRRVVRNHTDEILNYFGKCKSCGYPAHAESNRRIYDTGEIETLVIASCDLPCGWSDQVSPTTMTGPAARRG